MASSFTIRRLALTEGDWTQVVSPIHASGFTIDNAGVATLLCRSEQESSHHKRLAVGASYTIQSVVATFDPDAVVCWLTSTYGPGLAVVSFVR